LNYYLYKNQKDIFSVSDFCKQKFVLDSLIVDPDANTINRRGAEKRLEPKVMALLCLFANNFGQVVSREQITAEIWADVIVGEESITRAIFALRNALGDDAKQPKFIETIPKKGYRLLVEPKLINLDIAKSAPARKPTRKIVAILLSGGIAILLIVATFLRWPIATAFFGQYSTGNLSSDIDKILPVTKLVGSEGDMAILAAKQTMVFVHATGVTSNLFTRDLKSGMETQITNDDWIKSSPIWIDGATLGYIRCKSNQCEIVTQHKQQQPEVLYSSFKPIFTLSFSMDAPETLIFIEYQSNELNELKSLNLRNGKRENFRDIYPHLPKKIFLAKYSHDSQLILVSVDAERPLLQKINLFTKKINLVSAEFEEIKSIDVAGQQLLVAGTLQSTHGVWLISEDKSAK
ncbi:MAG: transcriptional regulator, partial [Chitinophagaceae bacterium]